MRGRGFKHTGGFTLVELLVVVAMLGVVLGAVYSVHLSHMKTAFSQEEVIDVQQNLRIALDTIAQDLTMAGVMVPTGTNPIALPTGSPPFLVYSTNITMNTSSAEGRFARVTGVTSGAPITLVVDPPAKTGDPNPVNGFSAGDKVRIITPYNGSEPLTGAAAADALVVQSTDPATATITLTSNLAAGDVIGAGTMLAKTADASPLPHTIDYYLVDGGGAPINGYSCPSNQKCLVRRVNGTGTPAVISQDIVATNLSSLRFTYLNDSCQDPSCPGDAVPPDVTRIRAVRVTLQGATSKTAPFSNGARSREITSIIKLRNRR